MAPEPTPSARSLRGLEAFALLAGVAAARRALVFARMPETRPA